MVYSKPERQLPLQLLPVYPVTATMTRLLFHPHLGQEYLQAVSTPVL